MIVITNLSACALKNCIQLRWDNSAIPKYEITRYLDSIETPTETVKKITCPQIDQGNKYCYEDNTGLIRGRVYYYMVSSPEIPYSSKPIRVRYQPNAPMPINSVSLVSLSHRSIGISWTDYTGDQNTDVMRYEVYIESKNFRNINEKKLKITVSGKQKSTIYTFEHPEKELYVAVVPVAWNESKVLGVIPSVISEPWKNIRTRSTVTFSISPISQEEDLELVIDLSYGVQNSEYNVIIGNAIVQTGIFTDTNGNGRATVQVPHGIGPGRHTIQVDDGAGSTASSSNILLVPLHLSPIPDDIVQGVPNIDIIDGFDKSIVDRIRFSSSTLPEDTLSFRFKPGSTPEDLRLDICNMLAHLLTGAITNENGDVPIHVNIPVRMLPSFSYPPFIFHPSNGSLNLFGIVQQTKFVTAYDWARHINEFHSYVGGMNRAVSAIIEFNSESQSFGNALVDSGDQYQGDFELVLGNSYFIEVKEPINQYCISADGLVSFAYMPITSTPNGSLNFIVLVADGHFSDASAWADSINQQHFTATAFPRVVTSITEWTAETQHYGTSMIDTGTSYENNFALIEGKGYIVEVKQTVNNVILIGDALTTNLC